MLHRAFSEGSSPRLRALALAGILALVPGERPPEAAAAGEEEERVLHLLSRATFGPTPELIQEVHRIGRTAWLTQQLAADPVADPSLERRLAVYPSLEMTAAELLASYPRRDRDEPRGGIGTPPRIVAELQAAQLTRAVHARAQLREVLTDFWFNHFNVFAAEGPMPYLSVAYLRDAIRPHVLGSFADLLRATAESPAMLYYLDNYASQRPRRRRGGINENYARELLELHTLGVTAGYTQNDVVQVARAFTGWTITPPEGASPLSFVFVPDRHVAGTKRLLSTPIPSGGKEEGDRILELLASHPATAERVARRLAARFVADTPPESLVARARDVFLETGGRLDRVVLEILSAPETFDPVHRAAKVKSPLELVASALRATGAEVRVGVAAARLVADLGQPLLLSQPPTGWPESAAEVLSPGGMVARFDFAYRLAAGKVSGVTVDVGLWDAILGLFGVDGLPKYLLGRDAGPDTLTALTDARRRGANGTLLAALVLASPEFQSH